jgi:hypothetical protein
MIIEKRILSLDEYVNKLNRKPVENQDHEKPIDKINRMFKSAIEKAPEHTEEIKKEWENIKERLGKNDISNLDYQIKEILSRFNVAYLSESQEDEGQKVPGNQYNDKAKSVKRWLLNNLNNYNLEDESNKMYADILKYFDMTDKTSTEIDDFKQLVNLNLE